MMAMTALQLSHVARDAFVRNGDMPVRILDLYGPAIATARIIDGALYLVPESDHTGKKISQRAAFDRELADLKREGKP